MRKLFVFTADCHLQPNAWKNRREIRGDAFFSFDQIIDHCCSNHLPLVIGGDIFDTHRPDPESASVFCRGAQRMHDAHLPVYYVQGDHDLEAIPWPSAISPYVTPIHETEVEIMGQLIYGLDYQPRGRLQEKLKLVPNVDILVTHAGWSELQGIGSTDGSLADDVPAGLYVLTGDYHGAKDVSLPNGTVAVSPGSICMQALGESPSKSFIEVSDSHTSGGFAFVRIPLRTRPYLAVNIDTIDELQHFCSQEVDYIRASSTAFIAQLPEDIRKPIIRIRYRDDLPEAATKIRAAVADSFHLFMEPQHEVEVVQVQAAQTPPGAFDTLLGACQQLAPDPHTFQLAARLLRTEESRRPAELEAMRQEFLNASNAPRTDGVVPGPAPSN